MNARIIEAMARAICCPTGCHYEGPGAAFADGCPVAGQKQYQAERILAAVIETLRADPAAVEAMMATASAELRNLPPVRDGALVVLNALCDWMAGDA